MSVSSNDFTDGVVLVSSQFSEPMRVIGNPTTGDGFVILNLVGTRTNTFRQGVTLTKRDLTAIQIERKDVEFQGKPRLFKLGLESLRISLAQEYDPYFGLSISRVDPLPHQLDAVYNHLLKSARCRFLLADDAGAGKTIMAGLLLKELKLRGLAERILIVCPANLAFQWQRELADRFQESFHILRGGDLRVQYGVNIWNDKPQIITSMDLAKRDEILPSVRQAEDWDLVIVDEAHRMSARDAEHKSERYRLGELLGEKTSHFLLLTATPHKGDPVNFSLFLQLLDQEAYADVKSIHDAMDRQEAACYQAKTAEERLRSQLPDQHKDLTGELFFDAVCKALDNEELSLTNRINLMQEPPALRDARNKLADAGVSKRIADARVVEIGEELEGLELQLKGLRGEITKKEMDDYWQKKHSSAKMCLEPLVRALAAGCPLNAGKVVPDDSTKAALKIEEQAAAFEKVIEVRRKEKQQAGALVLQRAGEEQRAKAAFETGFKKFSDDREALIEQRSQWRNLSRQASQAKLDEAEATKLESSLTQLDKDIRKSQDRQTQLREQQTKAISDFSETYNRIVKALLGTEVNATVKFYGRQLDPKVNHRGDLTSAAIETLKILAFDLAAMISGVEGRGLHPRLLIHDGPREADMASDLYQKMFLLVREVELAFGNSNAPSFQYIITTTEPPPEELQIAPWRIEPILDASTKEGRLLGQDL